MPHLECLAVSGATLRIELPPLQKINECDTDHESNFV
jgi:hypothetical protein